MEIRRVLRTVDRRAILVLSVSAAAVVSAAFWWLAWRVMQQDRLAAQQAVQERLESAADAVAGSLDRWFAALDSDLDLALALGDAAPVPPRLAALVGGHREGALVRIHGGSLTVDPRGRLLFAPTEGTDVPGNDASGSGTFARGQALEFRDRNFNAAADWYRNAARSPIASIQAGALVRFARALRKAGRTDEAVAAYRQLATLQTVRVEGRPAPVLAEHAICTIYEETRDQHALEREAAAFWELAYSGRWAIERSLFELYAADAARWRPGWKPDAEVATDIAARRALSEGVEWLWNAAARTGTSDGGRQSLRTDTEPAVIVWRRSAASPGEIVGVIAAGGWLQEQAAADFSPLASMREGVTVSLADTAGTFDSSRPDGPGVPVAVRTADATGLPWSIRVSSAAPEQELEGLVRRRLLLGAAVAVMTLLLLGGTYTVARALVRELEVAELQSNFVATVSHEFRTPLASIRHLSDMLAEGRVPDESRRARYYQALQGEAERLQRLVETLLDFGRMEAGTRPYAMEPCEPSPLLESIAARFSREAARRGRRLESAIAAGLPEISADPDALTLAVWNLLDNAVKYSGPQAAVHLEANAEGEGVAIVVKDEGIGIARADQARVFDRFVRGSNVAGTGAGGSGLGLAIVRHIADAHGATMTLESEPGRGTTVRMVFAASPRPEGSGRL